MKTDLVICTYNRAEQLQTLLTQLLQLSIGPNQIIVVDSSDVENQRVKQLEMVKYFRSNHKNQPYQRYIGCQRSSADVIIYLDDDMEIIDKAFIAYVQNRFSNYADEVGIALHFSNKQVDGSLSNIPASTIINQQSSIKKILNWLSGYPHLPDGKLGYCGNRGKQPKQGGYTEWLSGGAFAVRREKMFQNFNFQLFDLFEEKMGMGEDALIGYSLSTLGKLYFEPKLMFYHNDIAPSNYANKHFSYAKRVMYSRLFLSLEKNRMSKGSLLYTSFHFIWYALCRLFGYLANYVKSPSLVRKEILYGSISGFVHTFKFKRIPLNQSLNYWHNEYLKTLSH